MSVESGLTYSRAGVDSKAGNSVVQAIRPLIRSTERDGGTTEIGGFGGFFDLRAAGYADPILVAATDGVGTKIKIAIETGIHDTIGIDLVAMSVNDIVAEGAEPLFFLDYYSCGNLVPEVAKRVIGGIADGCRQARCALIGGEIAQMPGLFRNGDYELAGFAVGAVERGGLRRGEAIVAGDILLGLTSTGVHSEGFSLVRSVVRSLNLKWDVLSPFDASHSLGAALLTPSKIYVRSCLAAIRQGIEVKALAHITGGGFAEKIPRVLPRGLGAVVDLSSILTPAVFRWLATAGPVEPPEMLRTFNCGIGMVVIVPPDALEPIVSVLRLNGEVVTQIGTVVPISADAARVRYSGKLDLAW